MISEQDCLFCKIATGKLPSMKIYEDQYTMALLDINPATPGHVLVIPKKHSLSIYDIDKHDMDKAFEVVKIIANRLKDTMNAKGVNVLHNAGQHAGQIVAHFHIHVIPRYDNDGLYIKFPRAQLNDQEMKGIQEKMSSQKAKEEKKETKFDDFY